MVAGSGTGVTPPVVLGEKISDHLIKPDDNPIVENLNSMILGSKSVLSKHPVNIDREKRELNPGNMIWLWGQGKKPDIEPLVEKYGVNAGSKWAHPSCLEKSKKLLGYTPKYNIGTFFAELKRRDDNGEMDEYLKEKK